MLPRIVLLALQIVVAWLCADWIALPIIRNAGIGREYGVLVYAAVYAVIVWLVGLAGGSILKDVAVPSGAAFLSTLVVALVLAVITLVPQLRDIIEGIVPALRGARNYFALAGAMIGYHVRR